MDMMLRKLFCQSNLEFVIYPALWRKIYSIFSGLVLCWRERMGVEGMDLSDLVHSGIYLQEEGRK